jgi:hypothetical protein
LCSQKCLPLPTSQRLTPSVISKTLLLVHTMESVSAFFHQSTNI